MGIGTAQRPRSGHGRPRPSPASHRSCAMARSGGASPVREHSAIGVAGHDDRASIRGSRQRNARGGRSMGEVLSRGWGVEGSARSPVGSDRRHRGAIAMMHIGSLVISTTTAGTFGQPRPCEQEGPAQGRSRPGIAGRDAAGSSMRLASSSGWLVHRSSRRPACDVTPWPQPARAGIGASSQAARSTQNTPANRGFARPDDSFTIQSLYD